MNPINFFVLLCSCIVEVYLEYDFFSAFSKVSVNKKTKVTIINLTMVFAILTINTIGNTYINLFCIPIALWIYVTILFDMNISKRLMYFVVTYVMLLGCEFLYAILSYITTYITMTKAGDMPLTDNIWQLIAVKLLTYTIFTLAKQLLPKSSKKINTKIFAMYMCQPITTIGIMLTIFYSGIDFSRNNKQLVLMTFFFALMLIGNVLTFYGFGRYSREVEKNMNQQIELIRKDGELLRLSQIIEINQERRAFVHDVNNYLCVMEELLSRGADSEAEGILKNLNEKCKLQTQENYSDNVLVDIIIKEKIALANKTNVNLQVFVEKEVLFGEIEDADIVSMISNLLDNAIRGAQDGEDKKNVELKIYMENQKNVLIIKIENDFDGIIEKNGDSFISRKKERGIHGLGINNVKKTAEKYDGIFDIEVQECKFCAAVILPI